MTLILPEFREFLKSLNASGVRYLVIGGYAVNYYGYSRTTGDMDIWVARDKENEIKLREAYVLFGFAPEFADEKIVLEEDSIIRMGLPPTKLEVMTDIDGVTFDDCYSNRQIQDVEGIEVPFISLKDLITNKKSSKRLRDLDDVERLPKLDDIQP